MTRRERESVNAQTPRAGVNDKKVGRLEGGSGGESREKADDRWHDTGKIQNKIVEL